MIRRYSKILMLLISLSAGFLGCAGEENKSTVPAGNATNNGSSSNQDNPLSPGNLAPPASDTSEDLSSMASNSSLFFQKKALWDSFSEDLKNKVWENYSHSAQMTGAGPGGMVIIIPCLEE